MYLILIDDPIGNVMIEFESYGMERNTLFSSVKRSREMLELSCKIYP